MRLLHIVIGVVLLGIFLRPDVQLVDIVFNTNETWAGAAAVLLLGILIGRFSARWPTHPDTAKIALWGLMVTSILGFVEYTTEWEKSSPLAQNQTISLSAASVETYSEHITRSDEGLYRTKGRINGVPVDMLLDTGASLVLLTYETAQKVRIDMAALNFDVPVTTVSGQLNIATVILPSVKVGQIELKDVKAAVSPKGQLHSNLLGSSFLSRLDGAEFKNGRVILKLKRPSGSGQG